MRTLAEALEDFDAPTGNDSCVLGARELGSASSSMFPFLATFTVSPHVFHNELTDPATLRLLADALDGFDEPGGSGGTCVHGARSVESSSGAFLCHRVASSLDTNSVSPYPTVGSDALVTGTQSAPHATHCRRADWGGQSYHSDATQHQLSSSAHSQDHCIRLHSSAVSAVSTKLRQCRRLASIRRSARVARRSVSHIRHGGTRVCSRCLGVRDKRARRHVTWRACN